MDSILDLSEKKIDGLMKVYGVTERELDATRVAEESKGEVLKRLVIERSALVAVDN